MSSTIFKGGSGCYALVQESLYATADGRRIIAQSPLTSSSESEVRPEPACWRLGFVFIQSSWLHLISSCGLDLPGDFRSVGFERVLMFVWYLSCHP